MFCRNVLVLSVFLLIPAYVQAAHELAVTYAGNGSSDERYSGLAGLIRQAFAVRFSSYGIKVTDLTPFPEQAGQIQSSRDVTVIRCSADSSGPGIELFLNVEFGESRKKYTKSIVCDSSLGPADNVSALLMKMLPFFEEQLLARVQIISEPSLATLTIDRRIKTQAPWESFMSIGRHDLKLSLKGYESEEKEFMVVSGNNRFNYQLKPIIPDPPPVISAGKKRHSAIWLSAAGLGGLCAGIFQMKYSSTDSEYDQLVSRDEKEYTRLSERAGLYSNFRNLSVAISGSALMVYFYELAR